MCSRPGSTPLTKTSLPKLRAKLGEPSSRGSHVQFGTPDDRSRYAFLTWACFASNGQVGTIANASGCPPACVAYNTIPYESDVFPDDNWMLEPCDLHKKLFQDI